MSTFALIVLGVLQGVTEFLPVSSSGHLLLLSSLFGVEEGLFVSVILHVSSLVAVLIMFRKDVWMLIKNPLSKSSIFICVSTLITVAMALVVKPILQDSFQGVILPITFALSGVLLFFAELKTRDRIKSQKFSYKHACIIGIAQGLALFPGLSRSGTTISAGLFAGAGKKECAKFSFLLSIPTILGSLVSEIVDIARERAILNLNIFGLVIACVVCLIVSLLSIKMMMKMTEKTNFKWFAVYLSVVSIVSMILFW